MKRTKKVSENYVCPNCWNQVQNCICEYYPPWQLIMVDVNIQEVVRLLNQKGYHTIGCCESHYDGNPILYIAFMTRYNIGLPDGFTYAKGKTSVDYYFKKDDLKTKEKYEKIKMEKINALLEWAKSLPDNSKNKAG